MLLLLVGLAIVALPIALSVRTVLRVVRGLGGVDASKIGAVVKGDPSIDLERLAREVAREGRGTIPDRLLEAATANVDELARRLALAEAVSEIERDVVDDVRVPRVAASLATSGGLFAAAMAMREGLAEGVDVKTFESVVGRGLTLAAVAVFGGVVCASLHRIAQKQRRARLEELDALALPLARRVGIEPDAP